MDNDPINWLWDEGTEVDFDQADVLLITGIQSSTLQNWVNRGLLEPGAGGGGLKGVKRKYSIDDLIRLAMSVKLVDLNVSANASLLLATDVWLSVLKDAKKKKDPHLMASSIAFVQTSRGGASKTTVVSGSDKFDFAILLSGQPVVMFAAGVIIKAVAEKAMQVAYIAERPAGYAEARS